MATIRPATSEATESERTTPEVGTSVAVARRLLASTQLVVRNGKLQRQQLCSGGRTGTGLGVKHELTSSKLVESEPRVGESRSIGDDEGTGERRNSIDSRIGSLRLLIDNHKSWSERRREIIVDPKTDSGRLQATKLVELKLELDSLNHISAANNNNEETFQGNFSNRQIDETLSTLAVKLTKDTKKQEEESRQQQQDSRQSDRRLSRLSARKERREAGEAADGSGRTGEVELKVTAEDRGDSGGSTRQEKADQADQAEQERAKGTKPPTFGLIPHKVSRLPYYSYHGKARNVDLVNSADRAAAVQDRYASRGSEDSTSGGASSGSGSESSLASCSVVNLAPRDNRIRGRHEAHDISKKTSVGRRLLSYSNISNLFPSNKLMNIGDTGRWDSSLADNKSNSKLSRFSSEERTRTAAVAATSGDQQQVASKGRSSRLTAPLNRRNSTTAKHRSLNSLSNSSPISQAGELTMRRQNSTGYGINGGQPMGSVPSAAGKYTRPASVAGGALGRQQRSPSASSLHYPARGGGGGSAGLSPYGAAPPVDPDCPVHGYWSPLSKSQQQLGGDQWADQPDLLYDPYPAQPFMRDPYENPARAQLYSPGGGGGGVGHHANQQRSKRLNGATSGAYYNNSSRFSVYHSPSLADGQRSSLAPASEQVRRILGYQPHARPVHLHPQWAYSRPFIHLMGGAGARSPSPIDLDDVDANGQPIIRPRFELYNQLQDSQAIRAIDFHPSGEVYAVGSNSRALRICAYPADYELRHFQPAEHVAQAPRVLFKFLQLHRGSIYCVAFNGQGQLLATGSNDQTVQIVRYNSTTHSPDGDEYRLTMHDGTVRDLCFIDDQTSGSSLLLSAGGGDNKIYVTDCDTITSYQSMAGHTQPVMALHHWGGANFVSASQDRTMRFWDLRTRACTSIVSAPPASAIPPTRKQGSGASLAGPGAPVCAVKVDPSGRLMVSGHSDSVCMLYDIRAARIIQAFKPHDDEIRTVSFSPKSYYLLTGGYDGRIVLSDLQGDLTQPLPQCCVAESDDKIVQSKWHPTDFTFVTTSADKTATLWALPAE